MSREECIAKITKVAKEKRIEVEELGVPRSAVFHDLLHPSRLLQVDARLVPVQVLHPVLDRIMHVERLVLLDVASASTVQAA